MTRPWPGPPSIASVRPRSRLAIAVAIAAAYALAACGGGTERTGGGPLAASPAPGAPAASPAPARPAARGVVVAAAGDIACPPGGRPSAAGCQQAATAQVLDRVRPAAVLALGDLQYETGALADFRAAFAPTWGRFAARMRPAPGNHEYAVTNGRGYYAYFGRRAGDPARGYYSFDLGGWHLIALNSNCRIVGCGRGSRQERWLRADLARHRRARCTLAYWHQPRFSSGPHGDNAAVAPLWRDLYAARADVVLDGHDHDYERFAPQTPAGRASPGRGIRELVAGTGGRSHYPTLIPRPNSQWRNGSTFGVLALTLRPGRYDWRFVPVAGASFTDAGSARCV